MKENCFYLVQGAMKIQCAFTTSLLRVSFKSILSFFAGIASPTIVVAGASEQLQL